MIEAVNHLLRGVVWHIPTRAYLQHAHVRVLCITAATSDADTFDVALTIRGPLPSADPAAQLAIALYRVGDQQMHVHYGRLNQRGQLLFRQVQAGAYQPVCTPSLNTEAWTWTPPPSGPQPLSLHAALIPTPTMHPRPIARGAETDQHWTCAYQNATATLTATLHTQPTGHLLLDLEAPDPAWDGSLIGFVWSTHDPATGQSVAQLLFAPLRWSAAFHACTAHLHLAGPQPAFALSLPTHPWPLVSITPDLAPILRQSVTQSATAHTRRAWQALAQSADELPAELRPLILAALQP